MNSVMKWQHSRLAKKKRAFFDGRITHADDFSFSLKNVYVFFSRQGWLYLLLLLITFVAGVNYGNNLILGLFFYLLSLWLMAAILTFLQVSSLAVRLERVELAQAQGVMWVYFWVINQKGAPARQIRMSFEEMAPVTLLSEAEQAIYAQASSVTLNAVATQTLVRLPIIATARGQVVLPRLTVESVYPLGVVRSWAYGYFSSTGYAYPAPLSFDWQQMDKVSAGDDEYYSNYYQAGQSDFDMLDEYVEGESLARVSWAHVARGMGMLTKRFADSVGSEEVLSYEAMPAHHHEERLAQLAFAILALQESGGAFRLALPSGVGELGAGEKFVQDSLLRLAKEP